MLALAGEAGALSGGMYGAAGLTNPAGWAVTGLQLASKFLGGKKSPSVLQGFDVAGQFGASGFSGTVTAFDQKGNRWDQPLEAQWLNSLGLGLLSSGKYGPALNDRGLSEFFTGGKTVSVSERVPGDSTYPEFLVAALSEKIQTTATATADMNAPQINANSAAPVNAGIMPPAAVAAASADMFGRLDQILMLAALAGALLWAFKKV